MTPFFARLGQEQLENTSAREWANMSFFGGMPLPKGSNMVACINFANVGPCFFSL